MLSLLPFLACFLGVSAQNVFPELASIQASIKSQYAPYFTASAAATGAPAPAATMKPIVAPATNASCSYWMETIKHQGVAAFNPTSGYTVFRNVMAYGAIGDGVADDTAAINNAITAGGRIGPASGLTSTTTQAIVYFPPGTYRITGPIIDYYITQLVGNPNCLPTIKADASFSGSWLIDGIEYVGGNNPGSGQFKAVNTFWRQVRNFIIDTTAYPSSNALTGIHWPTAQATSLQNIIFNMPNVAGTQHQGVFIEQGSGGWMTDLIFNGGLVGMNMGNQQFSMRNLTFNGCVTAINQLWDWGWTYKNLNINNCTTGVDATAGGSTAQNVNGVVILDSLIKNTAVGVKTSHSSSATPPGAGSLILENVILNNVPVAVTGAGGVTTLAGTTGTLTINAYAQGHRYLPTGPTNPVGSLAGNPRPAGLLGGPNGGYYERSKPQYQNLPVSSFVSVRNKGATGNGVTDDTVAVQKAINQATTAGKVVYFDAGTYRVTKTILFPKGARVVGEAFAVIMSSGSFFNDINNPVAVVRVGNAGDTGLIEWSDMIVSTQGPQAGAILIEWNIAASSVSSPNGMWDVHTRIGGFSGSNQQADVCPTDASTVYTANNVRKACFAAFMSMHVTTSATGLYMENNWLWTADHDVDAISADIAPDDQITVYTGRGLYVESTTGLIWMYGSAVEHHSKYQYQFASTKNIVLGSIQTETPYYQPNPSGNLPYPAVASINDPVFPTTNFVDGSLVIPNADAFGLRVLTSKPILIYGAGLYSFFNNYSTTCSNAGNQEVCQSRGFSVDKKSKVYLYDLHTVGTHEMITLGTTDIAKYSDNIGQAMFADEIAVFRSKP